MTNAQHHMTIPQLEECIQSMKLIGFDRCSHGSKQLAKLFTECVAFLSYICRDSIYIEHRNEDAFPSLEEIPAMRAILEDKTIFEIFLSMLTNKTLGDDSAKAVSLGQVKTSARAVQSIPLQNVMTVKQQTPQPQEQRQKTSGRKRAFSSTSVEDNTSTPKSMKMMKSPMPHGTDCVKTPILNGPTFPALGVQGGQSAQISSSSLEINFSVLASVIFYSVLRYVDQWPAVFLKLFAEDSFGPRIWVDDDRCQLFVQNLTMALDSSSNEASVSAEYFVKNFDSFLSGDVPMQNEIDGDGSDSDSGDEEYVLEGAIGGLPLTINKIQPALTLDDSSSSGEELSSNELVISTNEARGHLQDDAESESTTSQGSDDNARDGISPLPSQSSQGQSQEQIQIQPWWKCEKIIKDKVCNRYFGVNRDAAFDMIGSALSARLGEKVKQNSSLLSTLPAFTRIPRVRSLAASQLEKWLQSPALSGLARKLFSTTVGRIENVDPPLPEDISAIQSILSMSLKANQFHAHVENVIEIVKSVPTPAVCRQIVLFLLREEIDRRDNSDGIQGTTDNKDGLKMLKAVLQSISTELGHDAVASSLLTLCENQIVSRLEKETTFLCTLLKDVAQLVNSWYDGMIMVKSILSNADLVPVEVTARLVFESMLLSVPRMMLDGSLTPESLSDCPLCPILLDFKKTILEWSLKSFDLADAPKQDQFQRREPRAPVFGCILDGVSKKKPLLRNMQLLHCLLLLVKTDSEVLNTFLCNKDCPDNDDEILLDEATSRAEICMLRGRIVDDEMIRMIVKAAMRDESNIGRINAIELIESLLFNCRKKAGGRVMLSDCQLIWDLYNLTEHSLKQLHLEKDFQRIACPGMWWRVTAISLIICGASPKAVGAVMWDEHPTLRALMKMSVSKKFRFPTVDCDEESREAMKASEYKIREKESEIAEELFLSPEMRASSKEEIETTKIYVSENKMGIRASVRVSARQRAKEEKIVKAEREMKIARQQAEKLRIKRLLKDAQKAIIIWDPRSTARKPPKNSVQLLFSVSNIFHLAGSFIECTRPDYIINTIGSTNRDSIERAYDWLIPAISLYRSVIDRLPPSASCFLLLRAYGQDTSASGELLKLSAPLLTHVKRSLRGEHAAEGTKRAADLLFFDIADADADRRICARRVLLEALGKIELSQNTYPTALSGDFKWLVGLLETRFAEVVTASAIPQLTKALFLERGEVLHAYTHALHYYHRNNITECGDGGQSEDFSETILRLLSTRSHICCATMNRHPDMYDIMVQTVFEAFNEIKRSNGEDGICMLVRRDKEDSATEMDMPLQLVRAAIVLVTNGRGEIDCASHEQFQLLTNYMVRSEFPREGASSAKYQDTKEPVISVEEWVALVKARCEFVAKEAVQCVPAIYLPRILLCCGLPEQSFSSMMQRLNSLGSDSDDLDLCYSEIFSPATINEWGSTFSSKRTVTARRLYGRISAYCHAKGKDTPSAFTKWLHRQCNTKNNGKSKIQTKKQFFLVGANRLVTDMLNVEMNEIGGDQSNCEDTTASVFHRLDLLEISTNTTGCTDDSTEVVRLLKSNNISGAESVLEAIYSKISESTDNQGASITKASAISLLNMLHLSTLKNDDVERMLVRWIPLLSHGADEDLFHLIFSGNNEWSDQLQITKVMIVTRCLALWHDKVLKKCHAWAIEQLSKNLEAKYCARSLVKCFIQRSSYSTAGNFALSDRAGLKFSHVAIDINHAENLTRLALLLAERWYCNKTWNRQSWIEEDWMIMLLIIGSQSKDHLAKILSTMLVDTYQLSEWADNVLPRILLKLYVTFPHTMNLSDSNVREMLVNSSAMLHKEWIEWSSPLDGQFSSTVANLDMATLQTQQVLITDFIKKFPLFAIKHIHKLVKVLEQDAVSKPRHDIERGRQQVRYPELLAANETAHTQIVVIHWGCGFSEPLWVAVLDIMLSFPGKVLFSCGQLFGFYDILNLYLVLFKTQITIANRTAPSETVTTILRTKNKFSAVLKEFSNSNTEMFKEWISNTNIGHHPVSDLLLLCAIKLE